MDGGQAGSRRLWEQRSAAGREEDKRHAWASLLSPVMG